MERDKKKESNARYRERHPDRVRESWRKHRRNNPNRCNDYHLKNMKSWEGYIPEKMVCSICGKEVSFNKRNPKDSVHWDHRTGCEVVTVKPTAWLMTHNRTPENQKIWESCNFGKLCSDCNKRLPTKDRKEWFLKVEKYILSKDIC